MIPATSVEQHVTIPAHNEAVFLIDSSARPKSQESRLHELWHQRAAQTWDSLQPFFTAPELCADRLQYLADGVSIAHQTKPTNIGLGLLATLGAEQLGLVTTEQSDARLGTALNTIAALSRANGFFLDWYDATSTESLTIWPESNTPVVPFVSAVDNAWLAMGVQLIATAKPQFEDIAESILQPMEFAQFFDSHTQELWGGFDVAAGQPTNWHYSRAKMSEARVVHYITAMRSPEPERSTILQRVFDQEGQVPPNTHGGSLFEQLMPTLLVAEPHFHTAHQREVYRHQHGTHPHGWWGLSPCDDPNTKRYQEFGLGEHYPSGSVITPYAVFLALQYDPNGVHELLTRLETAYPQFVDGGYRDSVDVETGTVAGTRLFLDQSAIFLALTNHLSDNYFPKLAATRLADGMLR